MWTKGVFIALSTLNESLPTSHTGIRGTKQIMLIYYGIPAHQGSQETLEAFESLQCTGPDAAHEPAA